MRNWTIGFIASFLILLSSAAHAQDLVWNDLLAPEPYTLTQQINFSQSLILKKGTPVTLLEQIPLDDIRVQLFRFQINPCIDPALKAPMVLVNEIYGVLLDPGCILEVFLENQDLNRTAFFRK